MEYWLHYAVAVCTVALLLTALAVASKMLKRARFRSHSRIEVLESIALTPQSSVHVVRVGSKELLVGAGQVAVLADVSADAAAST